MLRLELIKLSKTYPAVKANDQVSLRVKPGEIHAVLGENGAGKSTLMKMIYGAVRPDEGEIRWNGEAVQVRNPAEA
ncbi:MAG: ATP-binding cassette domain-containing protein, partial [Cytophagales bacterium]|nr:ATP-binding cassette domain-containing protein [Rhizobacter sp.]